MSKPYSRCIYAVDDGGGALCFASTCTDFKDTSPEQESFIDGFFLEGEFSFVEADLLSCSRIEAIRGFNRRVRSFIVDLIRVICFSERSAHSTNEPSRKIILSLSSGVFDERDPSIPSSFLIGFREPIVLHLVRGGLVQDVFGIVPFNVSPYMINIKLHVYIIIFKEGILGILREKF
jgi:hypothetical protein